MKDKQRAETEKRSSARLGYFLAGLAILLLASACGAPTRQEPATLKAQTRQEMPTMLTWRKKLTQLDKTISPIANRPIDLDDLDSITKGVAPLDEAGVRAEAQALLLEILRALESATEEERRSIRGLVSEYKSFFWATSPPEGETAAETLRLRLMHFALKDQYPDPRDAVMWLQDMCETPGVPLETLASLRREVAPMASDEDRYGFGSTRSMLLRGYQSGHGKRGALERDR